jgi:hypothetical protein
LELARLIFLIYLMEWWAREDSNLQPSGYEPLALTIELRARACLLHRQNGAAKVGGRGTGETV